MTFRIAVLRSYLTILKQLLQPLLAGNETSLAVGSRVAVNAAKLRQQLLLIEANAKECLNAERGDG